MSMFGGNMAMPSVADIAAVTRNNGNDGGFGDGNGWWVLIILFAIFGGWGNGNGWNNGNGGTTATLDASLQRGFDTQTIISKLDGINSGICSLGYDQLAQMNGINTNIMQTGFGIQQAVNADTVANMQNTNALQAQIANCCCENREAIAQVRYDMATDTCALKTEVHQTGDAIIQSQNQGFQALRQEIKDGFCNLEIREMQRENADLRQKLNNCDRDNALQGTASYIINSVRPTPIPAWPVQNPWASCNCGNGYNFNNGCGCGGNSCC